ncbi:MAG: hypothetical protein ACRDIL_00180 [Candidatus Limnocylindrales bacterium]
MLRAMVLIGLLWGLTSCQPDLFPPGSTDPTDPTLPPRSTAAPGRPSPTIEIPPPI